MKRFLCFALLAACGSDPTNPPTTSELAVVKGAGSPSTFASTEALTADDTVEAIGVSGDGRVIAVFAGQPHELSGNTFEVRSLYVGEGDPEALGAVHAIAPRIGGGAWIGSEAGLFAVDEIYTYKVPLLEDAGAVNDVLDANAGTLAGLWLAMDGGLHRWEDDRVSKYAIEGLSGAATLVAIEQTGAFGVAAYGDQIATLEPNSSEILVDRPPLDTGAIHALAAATGAIYAATDKGI